MHRPLVLLLLLTSGPLVECHPANGRRAEGHDAAPVASAAAQGHARVEHARVTVLSTVLTGMSGVGEWGFAALVEADGHRILFDTGRHPHAVLDNAEEFHVDLSGVTEVVLSHNHFDHTGGLVALRTELAHKDPRAMATAHVARGIFWSRGDKSNHEDHEVGHPGHRDPHQPSTDFLAVKAEYEGAGGHFVEHDGPFELHPGVWLTGPVPRTTDEHSYSERGRVHSPDGLVVDTIPEDQALVIDTAEGLVVISGCAHAGIVNTALHARDILGGAKVRTVIGGLHLFSMDKARVEWTADQLRDLGMHQLLGAHCSGLDPVLTIRERLGADKHAVTAGAVGSRFELGKGIDPGLLLR